jgi:hypothetical protein
MADNYDSEMDKALDACEESFTVDITQHTPTYVALQDAVKNYVEEQREQK